MRVLLPIILLMTTTLAAKLWLRQVSYDVTAAEASDAPVVWPSGSAVAFRPDCWNLLLFAHPHCPCTRATLRELQSVIGESSRPVAVKVLFTRPAKTSSEAWCETTTFRQAERLPGALVAWDDDGREAMRFSARSSGHVMLYDGQGQLRFAGGVTARRGTEGSNAYSTALINALNAGGARTLPTPVFGCPLVLPQGAGE